MSIGPFPASAVKPLPSPPPVERHWAAMGLPDTGWVLITDQALCQSCSADPQQPCMGACISGHDLPAQGRAAMGTCAQCEVAVCADVCPVSAIYHTAEGVVEIDQELCIGCRFCVDECPNDALLWVDPYHRPALPDGAAAYDPGAPNGAFANTVAKCTFCADRLMNGLLPLCADACPDHAVWVGNLERNTATNGTAVVRLDDLLGQRHFETVLPGQRVIHLL